MKIYSMYIHLHAWIYKYTYIYIQIQTPYFCVDQRAHPWFPICKHPHKCSLTVRFKKEKKEKSPWSFKHQTACDRQSTRWSSCLIILPLLLSASFSAPLMQCAFDTFLMILTVSASDLWELQEQHYMIDTLMDRKPQNQLSLPHGHLPLPV